MPDEYEIRTMTVRPTIFQNLDAEVDKAIAKMSAEGWEYLSQQDMGNIVAAGLLGARVLQFRRPKPKKMKPFPPMRD